mmetsp:Transcript_37045/g.73735  ORF Transcript_37045/g.73735 Transcript_37045/m.73735 type:complete len:292 (-) Transcript_37045:33-908(-)
MAAQGGGPGAPPMRACHGPLAAGWRQPFSFRNCSPHTFDGRTACAGVAPALLGVGVADMEDRPAAVPARMTAAATPTSSTSAAAVATGVADASEPYDNAASVGGTSSASGGVWHDCRPPGLPANLSQSPLSRADRSKSEISPRSPLRTSATSCWRRATSCVISVLLASKALAASKWRSARSSAACACCSLKSSQIRVPNARTLSARAERSVSAASESRLTSSSRLRSSRRPRAFEGESRAEAAFASAIAARSSCVSRILASRSSWIAAANKFANSRRCCASRRPASMICEI